MATTPIALRIEKHQLFIPESLMPSGSELILTFDPSRSLVLFHASVWAPIRANIIGYKSDSPLVTAFKRLVICNAQEVRIDRKHRLCIDSHCMSFASLENAVYWIPHANMIQLWNPDVFEKGITTNSHSAIFMAEKGKP